MSKEIGRGRGVIRNIKMLLNKPEFRRKRSSAFLIFVHENFYVCNSELGNFEPDRSRA